MPRGRWSSFIIAIAVCNSGAGNTHVALGLGLAPNQRGSDQRHHLVAGVGPARGITQVEVLLEELGQAEVPRPRVAGRSSPALAPRRWSSKVIWIRSGWRRDSIYWVLLVLGPVCCYKPLSQMDRSTFLPLQNADPTLSFGGLGKANCGVLAITNPRKHWLVDAGHILENRA